MYMGWEFVPAAKRPCRGYRVPSGLWRVDQRVRAHTYTLKHTHSAMGAYHCIPPVEVGLWGPNWGKPLRCLRPSSLPLTDTEEGENEADWVSWLGAVAKEVEPILSELWEDGSQSRTCLHTSNANRAATNDYFCNRLIFRFFFWLIDESDKSTKKH